MSKSDQPATTISQALTEFLDDQKARISPKTFSKYRSIIELYKIYLENYWPGHDGEYAAITDKGGTYCGTFGPEDATQGYGEFLSYFMPRKVMCGKELIRAASTVTKKLAEWLTEKGYTSSEQLDQGAARH